MCPDERGTAFEPMENDSANWYRVLFGRTTPLHNRLRALKVVLRAEAVGVVVTVALYLLLSPFIESTLALVVLVVTAAAFVGALAVWSGRRRRT